MSFDDFIMDFDASKNKEAVKITPTIVTETFDYGQKLIDTDYLPQISKIKILKKYLIDVKEMNLYNLGWRFQFGSFKNAAGLCSSEHTDKKDIYVSIQVTKHDSNWKQNMQDVIHHEISHAIISEIFRKFPRELHKIDDQNRATKGHGKLWKEICKKLCNHECRIEYENSNFKDSFKNFKYNCTFCGHNGYGDYLKFTDNCSQCGKSIITENNIS